MAWQHWPHWPQCNPQPLQVEQVTQVSHVVNEGHPYGVPSDRTPRVRSQKNLPEWADEFSKFLLLTGQQHADVRTKCTLIKKSCKEKFLQLQVKTAIRQSSSWGDFLKRLEGMYPVYETDLSVRTEIEELLCCPRIPHSCPHLRVRGADRRAHGAYEPLVGWAYCATSVACGEDSYLDMGGLQRDVGEIILDALLR